jgi:hypothetical protein
MTIVCSTVSTPGESAVAVGTRKQNPARAAKAVLNGRGARIFMGLLSWRSID